MNTPQASKNPLRVYLADDHAVVRQGLRMLVDAEADMQVIGEASDGETAWRVARGAREAARCGCH